MEYRILQGDCLQVLRTIPDASVHCCVTSPPYWGLRDYGNDAQIGLESTPEEYVAEMVDVFREVRRVLRDDGTCWLNLGDSYKSGKQLVGIPWRVALALQADGWWLRQDIIWHKPNPMPESVRDRCTKAHEYVFLLTKSERYYYDAEAVKENCVNTPEQQIAKRNKAPHKGQTDPGGKRDTTGGFDKIDKVYSGRNRRSVWTITTKPYSGAHFAVMPPDLVKPCVLAGCPIDGTVLDPFAGSGTVAAVALSLGRSSIGIELNSQYVELARERIAKTISSQPLLYNLEGR